MMSVSSMAKFIFFVANHLCKSVIMFSNHEKSIMFSYDY